MPDVEKVEDNLTGFEALLKKAATTQMPDDKPKKRKWVKQKKSRRKL